MAKFLYTLSLEIEAPSREEADDLLFELPTPFTEFDFVTVGEYDEDEDWLSEENGWEGGLIIK